MKLFSTIAAIFLSAAIVTAAGVGAPLEARQACSVTMFTGRGFTGTSRTVSGSQCVSICHLHTTSITDFNGLVPL